MHLVLAHTPSVDGCAAPTQATRYHLTITFSQLCRAWVATQPPRCSISLICDIFCDSGDGQITTCLYVLSYPEPSTLAPSCTCAMPTTEQMADLETAGKARHSVLSESAVPFLSGTRRPMLDSTNVTRDRA